ncbi:MAG TPA: chemotaxis protein CheW [Gammaproteobacteria bacterium]|nr:chemotaxis protein CheW [Gammaproteobacteria bacterium]
MHDEQASGGEHQQYLSFRLGEEAYALPILAVKEILEYPSLTRVPLMASCVRGVLNLRGSVVPVVDLALRFGRTPQPQTRRSCVVIVEVRADEEWSDIGIVVDAVNRVIDIPAADIEPPPSFGTRLRTDFIHGMGKVDGGFVMILDAAQALSVEEIARLGAETGGARAA